MILGEPVTNYYFELQDIIKLEMIWFHVNDKYEHNINHTPINIEKTISHTILLHLRAKETTDRDCSANANSYDQVYF